jgi:hypothetical protein
MWLPAMPKRPSVELLLYNRRNTQPFIRDSDHFCLIHLPPGLRIWSMAAAHMSRFLSRTPGPPPFSAMNSTPASPRAKRVLLSAGQFFALQSLPQTFGLVAPSLIAL